MNKERLKKLDHLLREHTPDEENNLHGHPIDFSKALRNDPRNHGKHQIAMPESRGMFIKKNSRFRSIESHTHSYIEIGYIYSGIITEYLEGQKYILNKGQFILIDRNTAHSISYAGEDDILISIITVPSLCKEILSQCKSDNVLIRFFLNAMSDQNSKCNYLIFNTEGNDRLHELILELLYEQYFPVINSKQIMHSIFTSILLCMIPTLDVDVSYQSLGRSSATVVKALTYINQNYLHCSLEDTADYLGINASYLSTLLKQQTNQNFKDIVSEKRMQDAAKLLRSSDLPVETIADQTGYLNVTFFYKKFMQTYHCKPSEYRKKQIIE